MSTTGTEPAGRRVQGKIAIKVPIGLPVNVKPINNKHACSTIDSKTLGQSNREKFPAWCSKNLYR